MVYGSVDVSTGSKNQYNRICYNTSFPFRQRVATCGFSRDLNCDGRMLDPLHLVLQCGRLGVSVGDLSASHITISTQNKHICSSHWFLWFHPCSSHSENVKIDVECINFPSGDDAQKNGENRTWNLEESAQ